MPKSRDTALLVGLTIGVAGSWLWWGRRSKGRSALGIMLPSWLTGERASDSPFDLALAASKMVARAVSGTRLTDYRKAEDLSYFWSIGSNNEQAYLKSAYWLAVASRLLGDSSLARSAAAFYAKGHALAAAPGSSYINGSVGAIYADAVKALASRVKGNAQASAVLAALRRGADPDAVASAKAVAQDKAVVENTLTASAKDAMALRENVLDGAGTLAQVWRGFWTGEAPQGWGSLRWFLWKWGLRTAAAGAVVLGAAVYFRKPLSVARGKLAETRRMLTTAAEAA